MTTRKHLQPTELGTVLSVWAHPDDETFLAGGIMAAVVAGGQDAVCVSATAGELGTSDATVWPPERLSRVRRWEAAAAMAVLGVRDHRFLDLPDGGLADEPAGPAVRALSAALEEVDPDTILTFGPDGLTFHPDHRTVSAWVRQAWIGAGCRARLLHAALAADHLRRWGGRFEEWGVYLSEDRPQPVAPHDLAVDHHVEGAALEQKLTALRTMHTQTAPSLELLGLGDFAAINSRESFVERLPPARHRQGAGNRVPPP